jgi:hypothetical protein
MLQRHARRSVSLDKLDRRRVVGLAVSIVVADGEDDGGNPDQRRPVGCGEVDGQRSGEAGPDDHESAVQEAEAVDVDAKLAETPAGGWHGLVLDALEEHAAWWRVSKDFARWGRCHLYLPMLIM